MTVQLQPGLKSIKSGFERTLAAQLKAAKVPFEYESLKLPYSIDHTYHPDFILPNGIIIEAKGYFRPGDIAKMRAVKRAHPSLDIRFVFMYKDKRIPGQKTTHEQWAERHGFPYASEKIPETWLQETREQKGPDERLGTD